MRRYTDIRVAAVKSQEFSAYLSVTLSSGLSNSGMDSRITSAYWAAAMVVGSVPDVLWIDRDIKKVVLCVA